MVGIKRQDKEGNPTMTTRSLVEEQKEIVRQFFQRFSAGDIPGVLSLFRDDASYWLATTRETLDLGRLADGLKFVQSRLKGPIRYEIGTMIAELNKIAVQVEGFGKTVEVAIYNNLYHVYFQLEGDKYRKGHPILCDRSPQIVHRRDLQCARSSP
jgi:ketosteroid isomerase-like protein